MTTNPLLDSLASLLLASFGTGAVFALAALLILAAHELRLSVLRAQSDHD